MELKIVETKGIQFIDHVPGSDRWYWGMDYTSGDLYEAEELFDDGHEIRIGWCWCPIPRESCVSR